MNARIITEHISKEKIIEAFNLGEYQKDDFEVYAIKYKMYGKDDKITIEFEEQFDFCKMMFIMVDLFETSRNLQGEIQGFVDTDKSNKITEHLNGERICFYLAEEVKVALKENKTNYLDILDLVSESNINYTINTDNFLSYTLESKMRFDEPNIELLDYELIEEGEYLYEIDDYENEYLETLNKANER